MSKLKLGSRTKDLTGKKFGSLVVTGFFNTNIHRASVWNCECVCGKITKNSGNSLTSGHTKSCGCAVYKNLSGKKFGNTMVVKRRRTGKNRKSIYTCLCKCGKTFERASDNIQRKSNVGCGCESPGRRLENGIAAFNTLYNAYRRSAKDRNYGWNLNKMTFQRLTKMNCEYCDMKPTNLTKYRRLAGQYQYNGVDRMDNSKGYTEENSVPCCKLCNLMKRDLTIEQFLSHVRLITNAKA